MACSCAMVSLQNRVERGDPEAIEILKAVNREKEASLSVKTNRRTGNGLLDMMKHYINFNK